MNSHVCVQKGKKLRFFFVCVWGGGWYFPKSLEVALGMSVTADRDRRVWFCGTAGAKYHSTDQPRPLTSLKQEEHRCGVGKALVTHTPMWHVPCVSWALHGLTLMTILPALLGSALSLPLHQGAVQMKTPSDPKSEWVLVAREMVLLAQPSIHGQGLVPRNRESLAV